MTMFKGKETGFNPTGSNDTAPNMMGPPATKFGGRGGLPMGPLKHYPGAVANISGGNRTLAKNQHGDGGGDSTRFSGTSAFNGNSAPKKTNAKPPATKRSAYSKKGL